MNLLNKNDNKMVLKNNKRFLNLLANTSTHSNNNYRGEGTIHLYQLNHRTGKKNFNRPFRNWDITYLIKHIDPYSENWFTVNSVKGINRSEAQVVGYNSLYVDIDVMKKYLEHHDKVCTDKLRQNVLFPVYAQLINLISNHKILKPNAIVMTGNGFHLYWLFSHQVTDHMINKNHDIPANEWKDLEEFIFKQVSCHIAGCDHSATDNKRILRMPFSNNTKQYAKTGNPRDLIPVQVWYFNPNRHNINYYLKKYHQHEHQNDVKRGKNAHTGSFLVTPNKHTYPHKSQAFLHFADSLYAASGMFNNNGRRENMLFYYTSLIMHANAYSVKHHYTSAQSVKNDVIRCLYAMNKRFGHYGDRLSDDEIMVKLIKRIKISKFNTHNSKKDKKNHDIAHYCFTKDSILDGCNFSEHEQVFLRYLRSSDVQKYCNKVSRYNRKMENKISNQWLLKKQFALKMSLANKAVYLHDHKHFPYRKLVKIINRSIVNKIVSKHSHHYTKKQLDKKKVSLSTLRRLITMFKNYMNRVNSKSVKKLYILSNKQLTALSNLYIHIVLNKLTNLRKTQEAINKANSWNRYNLNLSLEQDKAVDKIANIA